MNRKLLTALIVAGLALPAGAQASTMAHKTHNVAAAAHQPQPKAASAEANPKAKPHRVAQALPHKPGAKGYHTAAHKAAPRKSG